MNAYRLECASPGYIAAFSQAYFVGLVVSAMLAPTLIEPYGRKPVFIISRFVSGVIFTLMIALPMEEGLGWSELTLQFLIFLFGCNVILGYVSGMTWFTEFMPVAWQPYAITFWLI